MDSSNGFVWSVRIEDNDINFLKVWYQAMSLVLAVSGIRDQ